MYDKFTAMDMYTHNININDFNKCGKNSRTKYDRSWHQRALCIIIVIIIGHLNRRHGSWRHEPRTLIDAEARAGRRHMVILRVCIGNDDDDNNNNCIVIDRSSIFYDVRAVIIYYSLYDSIRSFRFEFFSPPHHSDGPIPTLAPIRCTRDLQPDFKIIPRNNNFQQS